MALYLNAVWGPFPLRGLPLPSSTGAEEFWGPYPAQGNTSQETSAGGSIELDLGADLELSFSAMPQLNMLLTQSPVVSMNSTQVLSMGMLLGTDSYAEVAAPLGVTAISYPSSSFAVETEAGLLVNSTILTAVSEGNTLSSEQVVSLAWNIGLNASAELQSTQVVSMTMLTDADQATELDTTQGDRMVMRSDVSEGASLDSSLAIRLRIVTSVDASVDAGALHALLDNTVDVLEAVDVGFAPDVRAIIRTDVEEGVSTDAGGGILDNTVDVSEAAEVGFAPDVRAIIRTDVEEGIGTTAGEAGELSALEELAAAVEADGSTEARAMMQDALAEGADVSAVHEFLLRLQPRFAQAFSVASQFDISLSYEELIEALGLQTQLDLLLRGYGDVVEGVTLGYSVDLVATGTTGFTELETELPQPEAVLSPVVVSPETVLQMER